MLLRYVYITILTCCISQLAFAQKRSKNKTGSDTTGIIRQFVRVCNFYKKAPLQLTMECTSNATVKTSENDSSSVMADFYFTDKGSYIKYGNTEQIVNDSFSLMISLDRQVMMVYPGEQNLSSMMDKLTGLQASDSSIQRMAATYTSTVLTGGEENVGIIELKSRALLSGTEIAREIIKLQYSKQTGEPETVVYLRRTLIPLEKDDLAELSKDANLSMKIVTLKEKSFLINERMASYAYKTIRHDDNIKLPVSISDRIKRNQAGTIVPAQGFENYYISVD